MPQNILVLNCGSSSLKFAVIQPSTDTFVLQGLADRLNSPQAHLDYELNQSKQAQSLADNTHQGAIAAVIQVLADNQLLNTLLGVGHRVVHGGEAFSKSQLIQQESLAKLESLSHLAPLHNPVNILGMKAIFSLLPEIPQVAVFDTAFHQTLGESAFLYALPYEHYQQHGVRRYGFHGTSYRYVSQEAATRLNKPAEECHFLIAHLGNGCSACAVRNGQSVDTSMGLTPLEGLAMGTRSGDLDPGLLPFLCERLNLPLADIMSILNKQSGLLGLSGLSNDMREIQQAAQQGHIQANLAIEVFAFKIARYLGALAVSLPKIDALIFTGGIGENDRLTRSLVLEHLTILGFEIDGELNQTNGNHIGQITTQDSTLSLVVATNEELMIAQDTLSIIQ
ncbi:acetate kinase [Oceaniserpentilla sp. 4NH20-0058]|uniref:acetate kinase n=1 Tax=Oceaniserpentilla sp. 4NH20-0058 TaxID=3127660 RepID=UPI0031042AAA